MRKLLPSIQVSRQFCCPGKKFKAFYTTGSSMLLVTVRWQSQDSPPPQTSLIQSMPTKSSPAPDNAPTPICELLSCNQKISPNPGFTTTLSVPISRAAWLQLSGKRDISSRSGDEKEEALPQPNPTGPTLTPHRSSSPWPPQV